MLSGTSGFCPDCRDERILVAVSDTEFFCTACDGAVIVLDGIGAAALVTRLAS
jgi:ribosomal protein S27E